MALSNDFDFKLNRDALIKRTLLMLSVISASQTPTADLRIGNPGELNAGNECVLVTNGKPDRLLG